MRALLLACAAAAAAADEPREPIGGRVDEHGCRPAAGYVWCAPRNACVRGWVAGACPEALAEHEPEGKHEGKREGGKHESEEAKEDEEAEEEEDSEEAEEEERALKLNIIVLTVSVLVSISLAFEYGHEHLLEHTSETMRPIIEGLFAELTLLGFIGLTLFLVFKMEWLKVASEHIYGDEKVIPELGEAVHMVLFFVMVIFLGQAIILARLGDSILLKWKNWESRSLESLSPQAIVDCRRLAEQSTFRLTWFEAIDDGTQLLVHSLTRERFKEVHGLNPADFEFASYLGVALGKTLAELVEVPVKTWMLLEVALLVFWRVDAIQSPDARFCGWVAFGFFLPCVAAVVHGKLRRILLDHARPLVRTAEERGGGVGLLQSTTLMAPRRQKSQKRLSSRRSTKGDLTPSETDSPRRGSHASSPAGTPQKRKTTPRKSKKKVAFPDGDGEEKADEPKKKSWLSSHMPHMPHMPHPHLPGHRPSPKKDGGAPAAAETELGLLGRAQGRGGAPPAAEASDGLLDHVQDRLDRAFGAVSRLVGGHSPRHRRVSTRLEEMAAQGIEKDYHHQFWFGDHHKSHFTLDILRGVPLGVAIYIAVLVLYHAPTLLAGDIFSSQPFVVRLVLLVIATLPPQLSFAQLAGVVRDFAIVANVESLQNLRFVEHVIRRQRTVAAFEALKVVTFLRKPDVVAEVLQQTGQGLDSKHTSALSARLHGEDVTARRERIEVARAEDERQERSWKAIFDVFDGDGEGSIDHDELRDLLEKFCSEGTDESQITRIIELLDDDASGEVDFEEFYNFGRALEHHITLHCDPKDLLRDMFEIIDDDHGGLITVQELHQTIREIGQELSIDDVYNLIKDIDDDGNGALDIHEFHLLLNRVGCDFLGEANKKKKKRGEHH